MLHDTASAICKLIIDGGLGLARPPDWHDSDRPEPEGTCYFSYDISPTLSVGGRVVARDPSESTLYLNAVSTREP